MESRPRFHAPAVERTRLDGCQPPSDGVAVIAVQPITAERTMKRLTSPLYDGSPDSPLSCDPAARRVPRRRGCKPVCIPAACRWTTASRPLPRARSSPLKVARGPAACRLTACPRRRPVGEILAPSVARADQPSCQNTPLRRVGLVNALSTIQLHRYPGRPRRLSAVRFAIWAPRVPSGISSRVRCGRGVPEANRR